MYSQLLKVKYASVITMTKWKNHIYDHFIGRYVVLVSNRPPRKIDISRDSDNSLPKDD